MVEGPGRKLVRSLSARSGGSAHYTLVIGAVDFEASAAGYRPFGDDVLYRAHYVSPSHVRTLVNLKVLNHISGVRWVWRNTEPRHEDDCPSYRALAVVS